MAAEVLENLARFPHCILLTRVGQFYEVCLMHRILILPPSFSPSLLVILRPSSRGFPAA